MKASSAQHVENGKTEQLDKKAIKIGINRKNIK